MLELQNILSPFYQQNHSCIEQLKGTIMPRTSANNDDVFMGKLYPDLRPWCLIKEYC